MPRLSETGVRVQFQLPEMFWRKLVALKERIGAGSHVEVFKAAINALEEKLNAQDKRKPH